MPKGNEPKKNTHLPSFLQEDSPWIDSTLNALSLEQKIAQLIMYPVYTEKGEQHIREIESLIKENEIGGVIFMQGSPTRQVNVYNRLQEASKIPLVTSIDGEWGVSMRLDSAIKFPRQMMLGAIQDDSLIYAFGREVARQCSLTGVHVNFAPDIDVNVNANNPVINTRSFGEVPATVAKNGVAYMRGMQDYGVLACAKHFPGHGDTDADSHYSLPVINHSRSRLDSVELQPFQALIDSGVGSVMVAHLFVPALDKEKNKATTLSKKVVTRLLRDSMGFKGLTFTDALNMHGVSKYYETGEVDLLAFEAGNDILLFSQDVPKAVNAIADAVRKGDIDSTEVDRRCRRVLQLKSWLKLDKYQPLSNKGVVQAVNRPKADALNRQLVQSAITLVKNDSNLVPIQGLHTKNVVTLQLGWTNESVFQSAIERYAEGAQFNLPKHPSKRMVDLVLDSLKEDDILILGVRGTSSSASRNYGVSKDMIALVDRIVAQHSNTVVSIFANPYVMNSFSNLDQAKAVVMAYEYTELAQEYAAQLIFGGIQAKGKLPVSAGGFKVNTGLFTSAMRLKYGVPELQDMDSKVLAKVDEIALKGIEEKAYPGCQILVARRGEVVYHKSFGHHTYEKKTPVHWKDLYDLASVTKVAASVPALMKMVEEERLNLDYNLCDYLPGLDSTEYFNMNIRRMLAHTAGLVSWIPFYTKTMSRGQLKFDVYSSVKTPIHQTQVAEDLYIKDSFKDSIRHWIYTHGVHKKKEYRYSDLGYYFYKDIVEGAYQEGLNTLVDSLYYEPLGARRLTYLPLEQYSKSEIVPTENDMIYRKRLIHGYVHDPGAAMLGGVGGHAGLFSNANDLAKLFQMFLNWGEYGGERFLAPETIKEFIKCQYCQEDNRRGAGFDKPSTSDFGPTCTCVSYESYGHTGFTGTMAWADPDKEIVYIFLSNRVYPDADNKKLIRMNIRTDIQEVIYESITDGK